MASSVKVTELVKRMTHEDLIERAEARRELLALDEDAIDPLIDEYYAGVTEVACIAILDILARIGGEDVLDVLRQVFKFEPRPSVKLSAGLGLMRNRSLLHVDEVEELILWFQKKPT